MALFRPLTTPAVIVRDSPRGLPIANTDWPTFSPFEEPICTHSTAHLLHCIPCMPQLAAAGAKG